MSIYQDKKSGKWYFEAMIRGKRYHRAISEAVTKKDAEIYFNAFKTDLLRGKLDLVENIGCKLFKELVKVYVEYSKTNHRSYKTNVAKEFHGLIDSVSVSLNASNEDDYDKICKPKIKNAYEEVKKFIKACVDEGMEVSASIVTGFDKVHYIDAGECEKIAKSLGAKFRNREFIENGY